MWGWECGMGAWGRQQGDDNFFLVFCFQTILNVFLSNDFISHIGMEEWGWEAWGWELISGILFSDNC